MAFSSRSSALRDHDAKPQPADQLPAARHDVDRPAARGIGGERRLTRIRSIAFPPTAQAGRQSDHLDHLPAVPPDVTDLLPQPAPRVDPTLRAEPTVP